MKKSILNLGKALNKAEQKEINGGGSFDCWEQNDPCKGCSGRCLVSVTTNCGFCLDIYQ